MIFDSEWLPQVARILRYLTLNGDKTPEQLLAQLSRMMTAPTWNERLMAMDDYLLHAVHNTLYPRSAPVHIKKEKLAQKVEARLGWTEWQIRSLVLHPMKSVKLRDVVNGYRVVPRLDYKPEKEVTTEERTHLYSMAIDRFKVVRAAMGLPLLPYQ